MLYSNSMFFLAKLYFFNDYLGGALLMDVEFYESKWKF